MNEQDHIDKRFIEHVTRFRRRANLDANTKKLISVIEWLLTLNVDRDTLKLNVQEAIDEYLKKGS